MPTSTKRFTAIVEILEVTETPEHKEYSNTIPATKDSRELAKLVVRDETLEGLTAKLQKHLELV